MDTLNQTPYTKYTVENGVVLTPNEVADRQGLPVDRETINTESAFLGRVAGRALEGSSYTLDASGVVLTEAEVQEARDPATYREKATR